MPKPEPEPGEMIPDEPPTGKKGKRKKKKKGLKAVSTNNLITYVDERECIIHCIKIYKEPNILF